ncbi:MAG: acyl-CoA dehydrogenase FadE [Gammaproteobacteria bacterium]|nr:MAG: acyl-CoA dehydrogenase FadE [Gammaproteobacteria bacterium]
MTLLWLILLLAGSITIAYFRKSLLLWTLMFGAVLAIASLIGGYNEIVMAVVWFIFIVFATILNLRIIRKHLVSNRILVIFRKIMPQMSETERDAIEAGTVWWDADLFSGYPDWSKLLDINVSQLSREELDFLAGPVEELCDMIDDWKITHEQQDLPQEIWDYIKQQGFFGMITPKKYGGKEFSALMHSAVVMKIASRSIATAVTVMVPNSLGPAELLLRYGDSKQKDYYLPRLAKGEEVPCFALTGPEAGSDASAMPDSGVICYGEYDGKKDVLGIRLNWDKRYITLGPVASLLGLAFKLYDPDHLLGSKENIGITLALIPTNLPGITIGERHNPLNISFQNGPTQGNDVFISLDMVIGGKQYLGKGWKMLMDCLSAGRAISLPALSTGAGKLACRSTGAYSRIREQFHMPIGKFEGIQEPLARIAAYTYMMDAARRLTASAVDQGEQPSVISAIVKYQLTEHMRRLVNDAMDIQGGSAICLGPGNLLGRVYQAVPISITVEGANILTRSLIIFGQGAIRCHPYVLDELKAVSDTDTTRAESNFDKALFGHIGFTISNATRAIILGLTNSRLADPVTTNESSYYFKHLSRLSAAFSFITDISMLTLGGALKRKEKLSGRLADALSFLYLASATLKRYQDDGCQSADLPLMKWSCDYALFNIQQALMGIIKNFPNKLIARLLRILVFPYGRPYHMPDDDMGEEVASLLLSPSETRDRLTEGMHVSTISGDPMHDIDEALKLVIAADPIEKRIRDAVKGGKLGENEIPMLLTDAVNNNIITEQELRLVHDAINARRRVIGVDAFSADLQHRSKEYGNTKIRAVRLSG